MSSIPAFQPAASNVYWFQPKTSVQFGQKTPLLLNASPKEVVDAYEKEQSKADNTEAPKESWIKEKWNWLKSLPGKAWDKITEAPRAIYNFFKSDNATVAKGFFFKKIVPLMFAFSFFAGPAGWVVGLLGLPLSYLSGRYGDKVLKELHAKENKDIHGIWEHMNKIDRIFSDIEEPEVEDPNAPPKTAEEREKEIAEKKKKMDDKGNQLINELSNLIDDVLMVKRFPFMKKIAAFLKPTLNNKFGGVLKKYAISQMLMKMNVYNEIAKAENPWDAAKAGAKGGFKFFLFFKVGPWLTSLKNVGGLWGKAAWAIGTGLEWFGFIKSAADILDGEPAPKAA